MIGFCREKVGYLSCNPILALHMELPIQNIFSGLILLLLCFCICKLSKATVACWNYVLMSF